MVRAGAFLIQSQECVAVFQTPDQNLLHSLHAGLINIVLQHHKLGALGPVLDTGDYIFRNLITGFCAAGIVAVHMPIEVVVAFLNRFVRVVMIPGQ